MHGENLFSTNEPFPAQEPRQKLPFKELGSPGKGDNGVVMLVCSEKKTTRMENQTLRKFFFAITIFPQGHTERADNVRLSR